MSSEITKSIWGGLISGSGVIEGETTLRQFSTDQIGIHAPAPTSGDITIAAASGVLLSTALPTDNASVSLSADTSSAALISTLNSFLGLYSQLRIFTFHRWRTSWGDGNIRAITPDYNRQAFKSSPPVHFSSDGVPANTYDNIDVSHEIDLSDYKAVIATLRNTIGNNSTKNEVTINYCHSSCHSVCHSAGGRR